MDISLRDHVADDGTEFPNFLVMLDDRQVGIIGKFPGCHLNLLGGQKLSPKMKEDIRSSTEILLRFAFNDPTYELPSIRTPPELPSAEDIRKAMEALE